MNVFGICCNHSNVRCCERRYVEGLLNPVYFIYIICKKCALLYAKNMINEQEYIDLKRNGVKDINDEFKVKYEKR